MDDRDNHDEFEQSPAMTFVVGILLGCAVGAVAMLLLAPNKGSRTRKDMRKRGRALQHDVADAFEDAVGQVQRKARHGREAVAEKAEAIYDRGEDILDEQRHRVASAVEDGKNKLRRSK